MHKNTLPRKAEKRSWPATLMALTLAIVVGWLAVICWLNLHHDPFMWATAIGLSVVTVLFLAAAIRGNAELLGAILTIWGRP